MDLNALEDEHLPEQRTTVLITAEAYQTEGHDAEAFH